MGAESRVATVLFAKIPGLGIAKTRIAAAADAATAARVYAELLDTLSHTLRSEHYQVAYAGAAAPGKLQSLFAEAVSFFPQPPLSLGERLTAAAQRVFDEGYAAMIAIGADCPWLTTSDLREARQKLTDDTDVVIGPAADGGYYLAGCTPPGAAIFSARQWSTPDLFNETIAIANRSALRVHLLPTRADIDTLNDYHRWKGIP